MSPQETPEDTFQEKVSISVDDFSGSLEEFTQLSTGQIKKFLKQVQIESERDFTISQRDGKKLVFSARYGNKILKNIHVFTL